MGKNELNFQVYSFPSIVILYRYRRIQSRSISDALLVFDTTLLPR